jgi:hypothetical protein
MKARSKLDDVEVLRETNRLFGLAMEDYVPNPAALAAVIRSLVEVFGEPIDIDVNEVVDPSFATALEGKAPYPPYRG